MFCFCKRVLPYLPAGYVACGNVSTGSLISWRSVKFRTRSSIKIDTDNSSLSLKVCVCEPAVRIRDINTHTPWTHTSCRRICRSAGGISNKDGAQDADGIRKETEGGSAARELRAICRVAVYTNKVINFTHDSLLLLPPSFSRVNHSPAEGLPEVAGTRSGGCGSHKKKGRR